LGRGCSRRAQCARAGTNVAAPGPLPRALPGVPYLQLVGMACKPAVPDREGMAQGDGRVPPPLGADAIGSLGGPGFAGSPALRLWWRCRALAADLWLGAIMMRLGIDDVGHDRGVGRRAGLRLVSCAGRIALHAHDDAPQINAPSPRRSNLGAHLVLSHAEGSTTGAVRTARSRRRGVAVSDGERAPRPATARGKGATQCWLVTPRHHPAPHKTGRD
jgi:hypothetical protein